MVLESIIDAISNAICADFPDSKIYGYENVAQGLEKLGFFVALLSASRTRIVGERYDYIALFDVRYYPANPDDNREMYSVGETLLDSLGKVTRANGVPLFASQMHYQVTDGVLHFFARYRLVLIREEDKDEMEKLIVSMKVVS